MAEPGSLAAQFVAALQRQDRQAIRQLAAAMVAQGTRLGGQWRAVAQVMLNDGECALARAAAEQLVLGDPSARARFDAAAIFAQSGQPERAQAVLAQLPGAVPDALANAYIKGTLATNLGQMDEARSQLARAVALAPLSGQAWLALAMAGGLDHDAGTRLAGHEAQFAGALPLEQAAYFTALGQWREKQGEPAAAHAAYAASGAALTALQPYDLAADRAQAAALIAAPAPKLAASAPAPGGPIFVTGLPRSGTTLVEQILASHSKVAGGGEIELLQQALRETGGRGLGGREMAEAATLYTRLAQERFGAGRVVDKSLSTSRHAGFAAALFPEARFVWIQRDLQDCAWSVFRSFFNKGIAWSNDLPSIGRHFAIEERLHRHWAAVLGERVLTIDYAQLVERPEDLIPRIAAHCGLDFEQAMLTPHRTPRAVITNSAVQVRQPINRSGLGSSQPFADFLEPFRTAYREELQA